MEFLLLSLVPASFFGYQAYKHSQKAKNAQLEKQKFYYSVTQAIVSSILTALLSFVVQIAVENHKNHLNKTSESKPTSQTSTKIPSESWKRNSPHPNSPNVIPKPRYDSSCSGNSKLMSNWKSAQQHPDHPNVIASEAIGKWDPAPGYEFVTKNNQCDLRVKPVPNKNSQKQRSRP